MAVPVEAFIQISRSDTRTIKQSSLYYLLERLIKEGHPLIQQYKPISKENYFIINFEEKADAVLFPGTDYQESHLRVDKFFSENNFLSKKKGLTCAHYTETYENKVVHIYFNKEGYMHACCKENDTIINLEGFLEARIKTNSKKALDFLNLLVLEKEKKYKVSLEKSDACQLDLDFLSVQLFQENFSDESIKYYIHSAKFFIGAVNELNAYNDQIIDRRGELVFQIIQKLQCIEGKRFSGSQALSIKEKDFLQEVKMETSFSDISVDIDTKKNKVEKVSQENILEHLKILEKKINEFIVDEAGNITKKIFEANSILADLSNITGDLLNLSVSEINSIQEKIEPLSKELKKFLKHEALLLNSMKEVNLKQFNVLLPSIKNNLKVSCFIEATSILALKEEVPARKEIKISMYNTLFKESELFRKYFRVFSNYLFKEKKIKKYVSLINNIVLEDNQEALLMLLELNWNVDETVCRFGGDNKLMTLARYALIHGSYNCFSLLLQFGSVVTYKCNINQKLSKKAHEEMKSVLSDAQSYFSTVHFDHSNLCPNEFWDTDIPSHLYLVCKFISEGKKTKEEKTYLKFSKALIPYCNLFEIVEAISFMSCFKNVHMQIIPSAKSPGIICFSKIEEFEQFFIENINLNNAVNSTMNLVMLHPHKGMYQCTKILLKSFSEKHEINEVNSILDKLDKSIQDTKDDPNKKIIYQRAYLFLMLQKRNLSFEEALKIVTILSDMGGEEQYFSAYLIAQCSIYKEMFQKDPIYQKIKNNITDNCLRKLLIYYGYKNNIFSQSSGQPLLTQYNQNGNSQNVAQTAPKDTRKSEQKRNVNVRH